MVEISEREEKGDFIVFSAMIVRNATVEEAIHRATIAAHSEGGFLAMLLAVVAESFEHLAVERAREKIGMK